jgi:serine/threonine-protein kinase
MKRLIIVVITLLLTFSIKSQVKKETFKKGNFSIEYSSNWELNTTETNGAEVVLFTELEKNDTFRENVNVFVQDLKGMNMTMEKYAALSEEQIKTMIPDSKIMLSKSVDDHGKKYYLIVWRGFLANNNLKLKQFFFLKDEKAYIITYTALPETFNKFLKEANVILNSFKLNN